MKSVLNTALLFFLLYFVYSCADRSPEHIIEIGFSYSGGRVGYFDMLKITPRIILYKTGYSVIKNSTRSVEEKNNALIWNDLSNAIDLENLSKIDGGKPATDVLELNFEVYIETNRARYSFFNDQIDSLNNGATHKFMIKLDSIHHSYSSKLK